MVLTEIEVSEEEVMEQLSNYDSKIFIWEAWSKCEVAELMKRNLSLKW